MYSSICVELECLTSIDKTFKIKCIEILKYKYLSMFISKCILVEAYLKYGLVKTRGKHTFTYPYYNLFPGYRRKYGKLCSFYVERKIIYYRIADSIEDGEKWKT